MFQTNQSGSAAGEGPNAAQLDDFVLAMDTVDREPFQDLFLEMYHPCRTSAIGGEGPQSGNTPH